MLNITIKLRHNLLTIILLLIRSNSIEIFINEHNNSYFMSRKILLIGRHGDAKPKPDGTGSLDELTPEAFSKLYSLGVSIQPDMKEIGGSPSNALIVYSGKERTLQTAQILSIAAMNMHSKDSNPPQNPDDIKLYDWSDFIIIPDKRIVYGDVYWNDEIYKKNGKNSVDNIRYWWQNPSATEHEGVPIESGNSLIYRVSQSLKENVKRVHTGMKKAGFMVTHTGLSDTIMKCLIDTQREIPLNDPIDIGGEVKMSEFAILNMYEGKANAVLNLKGYEYKVDLNKL